MIADFLDIEQNLKRRFREDSISDIIVASLMSLPGNNVVMLTPPEAKTGSDFGIVIVQPNSRKMIQFRIQAKRLNPHIYDWKIGSYTELAHPHNTGKQSHTLVRSVAHESITTIPLYAFYNPAHVCSASGGTVSGVELASGWEIRKRIKAIVKIKPKRLPYKRIGSLQPLFFPLSTILCASSKTAVPTGIPRPEDAQVAVMNAITSRSMRAGLNTKLVATDAVNPQLSDEVIDKISTAPKIDRLSRDLRIEPSDHLTRIILNAVERREEKIIRARVKRPKILLVAS